MDEQGILRAIYKRALTVLGRRDCSQQQLRTSLLNLKKWYPKSRLYKEYTSDRVDQVIRELEESGLLDERRALRNMLEAGRTGKYGINRLRLRMIRNRYKKEHIDAVLREYGDYGSQQDFSKIVHVVRLKKASWEKKYAGDRRKLMSVPGRIRMLLAQKGFTPQDAAAILKQL